MSTEIVKVEAPKGLATEQVNTVKEAFRPNFEAMGDLEPRYKALTDEKLVEPTAEQCKEARNVRLLLVKTRTGTAGTHKTLKADALVYGRYCDGMKKAQEAACGHREARLLEIEKHFEILEAERVAHIVSERRAELANYEVSVDAMPAGIGAMEADVWKEYLSGVVNSYYQRKDDERLAEEQRVADEKAEAEERDRVSKENERLKKEAEDKRIADAEAQAERDRVEAERVAKDREERDERAAKEAKRADRRECLNPLIKYIRDYDAVMELEDEEFNDEVDSMYAELLAEQKLAAENEKKRIAKEAADKKEAARVADTDHRVAIIAQAALDLAKEAQINVNAATIVVAAIASGAIPHITINY